MVPESWKEAVATRVLDTVAELLERAIIDTYEEARVSIQVAAEAEAARAAAARAASAARARYDSRLAPAPTPRGMTSWEEEEGRREQSATRCEDTVATMERVPFDVRVRAALTRRLTAQAPRWLPTKVTEELVFSAVDIALSSTVDTIHMNDSVEYLLDQHRIAHRLPNVPVGARAMFLSRKERILAILLSVGATRPRTQP